MIKQKLQIPLLRLPRPAVALICLLLIGGALIAQSMIRPEHTQAATSETINFQARLLTAAGSLVADGNYNVEFKLYSAASGGSALWTETRTTTNRVRVVNGYLTVNLGSVTAFPSIDWDQELWMTMNIGGITEMPDWDGEMTPRLKLTAVPFAKRAGELAGGNGSNRTVLDTGTPSGNNLLHLPAESGTLCVRNSSQCGFMTTAGGVQLQPSTPGVQQTGHFNVSGTGVVGGGLYTPLVDNAGALSIGTADATSISVGHSAIDTTVTGANIYMAGDVSIASGNSLSVEAGWASITGPGTANPNPTLTINSHTSGASPLVVQSASTTVFTIANGGAVTFQNASNSASGFAVQNSGGHAIFTVDTTGSSQVVLGKANVNDGAIAFQNAANSNIVTLKSGTVSGSYTLTLPTTVGAAGQCLKAIDGAGVLSFQDCSGGVQQVANVYKTSNSGNLTTSFVSVTFDAQKRVDGSTFSHSTSTNSDEVTIAIDGWYKVQYYIGVDNVSGSNRSDSVAKLQYYDGSTWNDIAGTEGWMYNRNPTEGITSASASAWHSFTAGQKVRLVVRQDTGTDTLQVRANTTGLIIEGVSSATDPTTMQQTYNNSTGGTTPELKVDTTRGGLDIQDANTTIGAAVPLLTVRASNASGLGSALFQVQGTGAALLQNTVDSTAAFQVQNAAGDSILKTDTENGSVIIGDDPDFTGARAKLVIGNPCGTDGFECVAIFEGPYLGESSFTDSDVLQLQGAEGIRFSTTYSRTSRMVIDYDGRVGIGTEAPSESLTVLGSFNVQNTGTLNKQLRMRTSGSGVDFETGGADLYISGWSGADFTGTQHGWLRGNLSLPGLFIGGGAGTASPMKLILADKNTSGDPGGYIGAMYYNSNSGRFRCYEVNEWKDCVSMVEANGTSNAGVGGSTTSGTYVNMPGTSSLAFTKKATNSKLVVTLNTSFWSTATTTGSRLAVRIDTTDYDCTNFFFNTASVHTQLSCTVVISGSSAGSKTLQARWRRVSGTGTLQTDSNDWTGITVIETN